MPPSEQSPEQPQQYYIMEDLPDKAIAQMAMAVFPPNIKVLRLANDDAYIHIKPESLKTVFTEEEMAAMQNNLFQAMYELADLSGSQDVKDCWILDKRPFTVFLASSKVRTPETELADATPANLIDAHIEQIDMEREETKKLAEYIRKQSTTEAPNLAVLMALTAKPEIAPVLFRHLEVRLVGYSEFHQSQLQVVKPTLSQAIQLAISELAAQESRLSEITTSTKGPNNKNIVVRTGLQSKINLTEERDVVEQRPLPTLFVERKII